MELKEINKEDIDRMVGELDRIGIHTTTEELIDRKISNLTSEIETHVENGTIELIADKLAKINKLQTLKKTYKNKSV